MSSNYVLIGSVPYLFIFKSTKFSFYWSHQLCFTSNYPSFDILSVYKSILFLS